MFFPVHFLSLDSGLSFSFVTVVTVFTSFRYTRLLVFVNKGPDLGPCSSSGDGPSLSLIPRTLNRHDRGDMVETKTKKKEREKRKYRRTRGSEK